MSDEKVVDDEGSSKDARKHITGCAFRKKDPQENDMRNRRLRSQVYRASQDFQAVSPSSARLLYNSTEWEDCPSDDLSPTILPRRHNILRWDIERKLSSAAVDTIPFYPDRLLEYNNRVSYSNFVAACTPDGNYVHETTPFLSSSSNRLFLLSKVRNLSAQGILHG